MELEAAKRIKVADVLIGILLTITLTITFYSETMLPKVVSMALIPVAVLLFLIRADLDNVKKTYRFALVNAIYLIFLLVISLIIWIANLENTIYIVQGSQRVMFQLINLTVAFCAVYLLREKAIDCVFFGAVLKNIIKIGLALKSYGPSQSVSDFLFFIKSGGTQIGFMSAIEIHDVTYIFGLLILYYLFASHDSLKKRVWFSIVGFAFFLLGFKRIALFSILVAILVGCILKRIKKAPRQKKVIYTLSVVAALIFLAYIPFIRYGAFDFVTSYFNIETNTRSSIYNFVANIYEFSPNYLGKGFDYIPRYLEYVKTLNLSFVGQSLNYLHNDILVYYIELGFWGFLFYLYYNFIFLQKWWYDHHNAGCAALFCILNLYSFLCFATGNTAHSYSFMLSLRIILFGAILNFETLITKGKRGSI